MFKRLLGFAVSTALMFTGCAMLQKPAVDAGFLSKYNTSSKNSKKSGKDLTSKTAKKDKRYADLMEKKIKKGA